ncbi:hotdog fold thioesterase [Oligoflexia bacterium]|nr:hotdog fold thioesterase [Oligoflexia bacterium]
MAQPNIQADLKAKFSLISAGMADTLFGALEMEFIDFHADFITASMPVNAKTRQSFGLLHGGASIALAETLASVGAWLNVDETKFAIVGVEINGNHIRAVREGRVIGTATPVHIGRKTHVWQVRITTEDDKVVCVSRCTLAVLPLADLK